MVKIGAELPKLSKK